MRKSLSFATLSLGLLVSTLAHADGPTCTAGPQLIESAFEAFDTAASPSPVNQPATTVLAPWLDYLAPGVDFVMNNDPDRHGRAAVADYFAPLLPFMGSVHHEIFSITPACGNAWIIRGMLHVTRRSDGKEITPIRFTDTFTIDSSQISRYEITLDPAALGQLFAP